VHRYRTVLGGRAASAREDYLAEYPDLAGDPVAVRMLSQQERRARRETGESDSDSELIRRPGTEVALDINPVSLILWSLSPAAPSRGLTIGENVWQSSTASIAAWIPTWHTGPLAAGNVRRTAAVFRRGELAGFSTGSRAWPGDFRAGILADQPGLAGRLLSSRSANACSTNRNGWPNCSIRTLSPSTRHIASGRGKCSACRIWGA